MVKGMKFVDAPSSNKIRWNGKDSGPAIALFPNLDKRENSVKMAYFYQRDRTFVNSMPLPDKLRVILSNPDVHCFCFGNHDSCAIKLRLSANPIDFVIIFDLASHDAHVYSMSDELWVSGLNLIKDHVTPLAEQDLIKVCNRTFGFMKNFN